MENDVEQSDDKGQELGYVSISNKYMKEAFLYAKEHSLDKQVPTGSVLVSNDEIIGKGANGSDYHDHHVCERVRLNVPTGQGYELCEGCHYKNHSEVRAIEDAKKNGFNTQNSELYLWGHWWCCRWCREAMDKAGVKKVFLLKNAHKLFNKNYKNNIIGKQFVG